MPADRAQRLVPPPGDGTAARRRPIRTHVLLDRALAALPLFRLSDSTEDGALEYKTPDGGRWRVLPAPGDRLPGTFDQDVYIELLYRYHEAGRPRDGTLSFTLHAFLRAMGRRVDGRTYEQLRGALARLERTSLESAGAYWDASTATSTPTTSPRSGFRNTARSSRPSPAASIACSPCSRRPARGANGGSASRRWPSFSR